MDRLAITLISSHQINHLLSEWGYALVFTIVTLQAAGVPLPGGSALAAAAIYAGSTHHLEIAGVIAAGAVGATVGNVIGFTAGRWGGSSALSRYGAYVKLTPERLRVGRYLFMRHGGKVVFFGRFVTGLRTWAAFLAGANRMAAPRFLLFTVLGAVAWAAYVGLGYFYFGDVITSVSTPIELLLLASGFAMLGLTFVLIRRTGQNLVLAAERALADSPP
jgi:membrane protein DedA with SNARE-associated domain